MEVILLDQWKIKDARVLTWILRSIDHLTVLNLRPYKIEKAMWDYFKKLYYQDHSVRRFQLEHKIANYSQGGFAVQDFFLRFPNFCVEFTDIIYAKLPVEFVSEFKYFMSKTRETNF